MNTPKIAQPTVTNPFALVGAPKTTAASWGFGRRATVGATYSTAVTVLA